jgi:shikimate kinase
MNFYILGYMASGKSKLAKDLSTMTGLSSIDLDEVFEERYKIGIVDFFEKYGDKSFRRIERQLLVETASLENTIIATGGGTACTDENIKFIKANGISIYIRMNPKDLFNRLKSVRKKRPLIKNVPVDSLEEFVKSQLAEREPFYMQADHIISRPVEEKEWIVGLIRRSILSE